uniref:Dynamin GTPase n=1 Tax=Odontella aurita TaxID=265563 RepID=A0A7S4JM12_9STRA|mmetsp:Transcript_49001/g.147587  ORF Transcript_49001/g.147587 Transcript_49001/m.147587 type:complete len:867 (+) Transcript_49001:516-3116(+)
MQETPQVSEASGGGDSNVTPIVSKQPMFKFSSTDDANFSFGASSKKQGEQKPKKREKKTSKSGNTDFEALTKKHIRPLIELNDEINKLTAKENAINSTRIVVAGDQSHGKTSLLEALSGVDLPRGEGIQTRVPLVLKLRDSDGLFKDEYALIKIESSDSDPERIALDEIGDKVQDYTERAAGEGKDVRDSPIELKIFRRNQADLTLVDLPGITRVALSDQAGGDGKKLENLIIGMCRRYMAPKESILLNVVSAMVDFTTSASLQLSRELDPDGERTMLCVTKVDQHRETGLHEKIQSAMDMMDLPEDNVFAVRNRSQKENNENVPLDEVRRLEMAELQRALEDEDVDYGLGVAALSQRLVKVQHDQIIQTLPKTREAIVNQISDLEDNLEKYGDPIGDAASCRAKSVQHIDEIVGQLQGEVAGRATPAFQNNLGSCEGGRVEITLTVERWSEVRKSKVPFISKKKSMRKFVFGLSIYPSNPVKDKPEEKGVSAYLTVTAPPGLPVKEMIVSFSVSTSSASKPVEMCCDKDFGESVTGKDGHAWGWKTFLSSEQADNIKASAVFTLTADVNELVLGSSLSSCEAETLPLCTHLANLNDDLATNVDYLYSNQHFFSETFRESIAREVSVSRGGIGLPGAVAPHVPVNVIRSMLRELPFVVTGHRNDVFGACNETTQGTISEFVDAGRYPKLSKLLVEESAGILATHHANLMELHLYILEWEETINSSNHYFMDTVQSIRSSIFDEDAEKPAYLNDLTPKSIKAMSNEDQKLVDMQIEIFAYWKLMKKRFVDNIIQSTHSELVSKPFNKIMKPALLDAVFQSGDQEIVLLLSPEEATVRKRAKLEKRLKKLKEAHAKMNEIKELAPYSL